RHAGRARPFAATQADGHFTVSLPPPRRRQSGSGGGLSGLDAEMVGAAAPKLQAAAGRPARTEAPAGEAGEPGRAGSTYRELRQGPPRKDGETGGGTRLPGPTGRRPARWPA